MKSEKVTNFGKIISVHGISPGFLQKAAAVSFLSFLFFLAMMLGFYIRQNIGYFLLATAFLIVNIFTLTGWFLMRRNILKIYENGFSYKKFSTVWNEIESVKTTNENGKISCEILKKNGEKTFLTGTIAEVDRAIKIIHQKSVANRNRKPEVDREKR